MTERQAADEFVEGALKAALLAAGIVWGVYPDMAPDNTDLVSVEGYVVYGCSTSMVTETHGSIRLMDEFPYTVRATALGNTSKVDAVEAAIQDALAGPFTDGNRRGVRVEQNGFLINSKGAGALSTLSPRRGLNFRYAGGRFLVKVRPLPQ